MAKADVVASKKAEFLAAEDSAIESAIGGGYDAGFIDGGNGAVSGGGFTQEQMDAAVKAATDPLNAQVSDLTAKDAADVQALNDAQAKATSDLAALQAALDAMTAKDATAEAAVADIKSKADQIQASLDKIKALLG